MTLQIACYGEILMRMTSPASERFLQSPEFKTYFGGAEANVAASLAQLGHDVKMVSTVADNAIGVAALGELRKLGVDTSAVALAPGRMGLYYLSQGAVRRPSEVIYDRKFSAFDLEEPGARNCREMLEGVDWLHISGVTPAIGERCAEKAVAVASAAAAMGIMVSFDGNYRGQLWFAWGGDGSSILHSLLGCANIAFVNERDIELILGETFADGSVAAKRERAFEKAFATFPKLEKIACTTRVQHSVDHHTLSGEIVTRDFRATTKVKDLKGVVDRIGAGDAFAAGVLHGLDARGNLQYAVDFGVAAACIKHSIPGDINLASESEIEDAMSSEALDVRR